MYLCCSHYYYFYLMDEEVEAQISSNSYFNVVRLFGYNFSQNQLIYHFFFFFLENWSQLIFIYPSVWLFD